MNKKNITKWLLIVSPIVLALYVLWPTFRYGQLERERESISADSVAAEQWDRTNGESFAKYRAARMKLGLDLRGGMYVTLEVDVLKLIEESADASSIDDEFTAVIERTRKETDNTDLDVMDTFLKNFRTSGRTLLQYFAVSNQADPTEASIEEKLKRDAGQAVDQALEVIKQRINKYEVSEAAIQKQGSRRIQLELPDVKDEKEIRSLLQTTARLEFKRVLMNRDLIRAFYSIDLLLKGRGDEISELGAVADTTVVDSTSNADTSATKADTASIAKADSAKADTGKKKNPYEGLSDEEQLRRIKKDYPFTYMLSGMFAKDEKSSYQPFDMILKKTEDFPEQGQYRFVVSGKLLPRLLKILERADVKKIIPLDLEILVSAKPERQRGTEVKEEFFDIYGVAREAEMTGDVITEAMPNFDPTSNQPVVMMEMNSDGAERWAQITGANVGKRIAIVLDGRVYSAPNVINKIPNGSSQITGMGSPEEATLLAVVLKAGALKAPVKIIEERVVGPSLGEDSIRRGVISSLISFAIVILFMLLYYAVGGGIADIALLMNVLLVIAALAMFGGTLTLPGIAGIILSTAMAVDANILIFERIREEMAAGRPLRAAVEQGYSKAWSAIIDSNVTNMLSGLVLLFLGSGPVKGFAVTLIIGVLMTLFTAVVVTRAMFEIVIASGATTINLGQRKTA
ncbi:MAG: protein translocase subunit SecD [Ignavibacteria bacterium]|nr:protein translocase subunit SecD [Ignavibacteria bacterium]